jgi:hypothetical protein
MRSIVFTCDPQNIRPRFGSKHLRDPQKRRHYADREPETCALELDEHRLTPKDPYSIFRAEGTKRQVGRKVLASYLGTKLERLSGREPESLQRTQRPLKRLARNRSSAFHSASQANRKAGLLTRPSRPSESRRSYGSPHGLRFGIGNPISGRRIPSSDSCLLVFRLRLPALCYCVSVVEKSRLGNSNSGFHSVLTCVSQPACKPSPFRSGRDA